MDINTQPLPGSLAFYCMIGNLRDALKYRSREAMGRNWISIFPGQILPTDHQHVEPSTVMEFVTELSIPKRGRPGTITGAAQTLLKALNAINPSVRDFKVVPEKIDDKPEPVVKIENTENPVVELAEKIDAPVPPVAQPVEKNAGHFDDLFDRFVTWAFSLSKLDIVFGVTIGIADYGLTFMLHEMGAAAAVVYTLISLHALGMAKNSHSQRTAQTGIVAVWLLELGAFCVHLTMFNRRLWGSIEDMPFRVEDVADEYRPFAIALVLALLFSGAGIYAVSTTLSLVTEKTEAENFEQQHGVKY